MSTHDRGIAKIARKSFATFFVIFVYYLSKETRNRRNKQRQLDFFNERQTNVFYREMFSFYLLSILRDFECFAACRNLPCTKKCINTNQLTAYVTVPRLNESAKMILAGCDSNNWHANAIKRGIEKQAMASKIPMENL